MWGGTALGQVQTLKKDLKEKFLNDQAQNYFLSQKLHEMQNILGIVQSEMVEMQAKQSNLESKIGEVWAEMARAAKRQTPPQVHIIGSAPNTTPAPPAPVSLAPEPQPGAAQGGAHGRAPAPVETPLRS